MNAISDLATSPLCLAIDVGGTKVEVGLMSRDGKVRARRRISTQVSPDESPELLWERIAALIDELMGCSGAEVVDICGVGCGGPMDMEFGLVSPLNIPQWRNFPLVEHIGDLTGRPVALDNDAKALALAEGWLGAARGHRNYLAMVVSTGVGGGIVLDGHLLEGHSGNAGHIGHMVVEPDGRWCACGSRGCLESEASGTAIQQASGRPASEASLIEKRHCGQMVGRAVASVVNLLDLDLCLVGGSVALGFGEVFFDAARAELETRAKLGYAPAPRIIPVGLGSDGPLTGAAAVARYRYPELWADGAGGGSRTDQKHQL